MHKLSRWFFSPSLAIFLLLVFAISMAIATFIENDFGTATAWVMVYDAWWFEMVMVLLGCCFVGNIFKYKLWRKAKLSILLFHLAFIVILIGAGITRYASYGGVMRIREGLSSNTIISDKNYVQIHISDKQAAKSLKKHTNFSPIKSNNFTISTNFKAQPISVSFHEFIPDAAPTIIENVDDGKTILELVVSAGNGRETIYLEDGEIQKFGVHQHGLSFNNSGRDDQGLISIIEEDGTIKLSAVHEIDFFIMSSRKAGKISAGAPTRLAFNTLYRSGDFSFVPVKLYNKAKIDLVSTAEKPKDNDEVKDDVLVVEVKVGEETKKVNLLYRKGFLPSGQTVELNGLQLHLAYGSVPINLPFDVKLKDFQLKRYPGSQSPSSYASEVAVIDQDKEFPYRIFMNNVLDYGGFRFYQASYDTDEKGTVLAVNHDGIGTLVSYLGYLLMGLGMFWTLFGKGSRFTFINKELKQLRLQKMTPLLFLMLLATLFSEAQNLPQEELKVLVKSQYIAPQHAAEFGRLMVQDLDGRIKPLNTLASEFLRKVSRKPYFKIKENGESIRFDANQTFLAMHVDPIGWQNIPLIKIDRSKGGELFRQFDTNEGSVIAFNDLLDGRGGYLLEKEVEIANAKKPAERNEFDKQILTVDERFNILFNIFSGNYLKIFPKKDDPTHTWFSYIHDFHDFPTEDAKFAKNIMPIYFEAIEKARINQDWHDAHDKLTYIKVFQDVLGKAVIPGHTKVEAELWYNKLNINFWLFQYYWTMGLLLLTMAIFKIFYDRKLIKYLSWLFILLAFLSFLVFTGNIILRWYVAGHAPWSNGYEMIVFVSWVLLFCGFMTYKKSDFSLPLTMLFAGTLLFVSYLDWLSPEITNLMPVLKSYWLKIHVATIVSSYAPLTLSALLGVMALLLMIFKSQKKAKEFEWRIKELTYINEISMTIGLFLLAVGTFLGGIWANESWGRYWAWDPKETWALISTIIYAAVLHLRFVPKLRSKFVLNTASVFAYSSIVMTSFGVNYYLSGLHSYAAGDPLPIPNFIYVVVAMVTMIAVLAFWRNKQQVTAKSI